VAGRAVILLAAAVIIGAAMLHAMDRGVDFSALKAQTGTADTTTPKAKKAPRTAVTATTTTSTTLPPRPPAEVKVLPVNGTNVAGVAGRTGDVLRRAGYNVLSPTNTAKPVDSSSVQYAPGHDTEAKEVAKVLALPDTAVQPLASPPPVADTRGADVIVIVGPDLAARTAPTSPPTTARRVTTTTAGIRAIPTTTTTARPATTTTTLP
jgi:LytR cell envelope-related transcriptional attenuator